MEDFFLYWEKFFPHLIINYFPTLKQKTYFSFILRDIIIILWQTKMFGTTIALLLIIIMI